LSQISIVVTKNRYGAYSQNGLNCAVRPRNTRTNTPDVIVANPDSATVISSGIIPSLLTLSESTFDISIDGDTAITIETFDSTKSVQTLDTLINKVNEQAVDAHLSFSAFKVRVGTCYELAISHIVPNFSGDTINRTIMVSSGSSNDGTTELGLAGVLDVETQGITGNKVHLNGRLLTAFGKMQTFGSSEVETVTGSNNVRLFSGTFEELSVRAGDTFVLTGSTESADDGSYRVKEINGETLTLDYDSGTFAGSLDSSSVVYILRNTATLDELTFTEAISSDWLHYV